MANLVLESVNDQPADSEELIRLMDYPDSTEEIPILDMGPYLAGEKNGLEAVARRLGEITETVGFFYLKNHSVPLDLVDRVFAQSRRFHALPDEEKRKTPYVVTDSFRAGYQPANTARNAKANVDIVAKAKPNLLSKFSMTRELAPDHPRYKVMNVWPDDLPGFRETVAEYHAAIERLGRQFLPLWATSVDMPADFFEKYFEDPHLTLSLLHYPPQKEIGNRQYGIAPHTDNSFMTFLAQSNVPGLAVRMPSGHWRIVENIPGTFLVNTGNVMVRWTNGRYLSTKHRVINTADVDRYSIPVFFGPSGD
ncbi:MAG TPA: 2-oxoglutarate and iron-dependent oxygenase domain-containing protein, partial [Beijerinckiaceae bacterium]|nr:2-oxoglutarate and iron-dependent oxygenase domain-containing protein [Beijerinckiaceae bacterium]